MSQADFSTAAIVDVAAAALINAQGEVLIAQRPVGKHMAGYWEFPGGKMEVNELISEALSRELQEEIGVTPLTSRPLITLEHAYSEKTVRLHVSVVSFWDGEVRSAEGQAIKWVNAADLPSENLLPADKPIADALRLPPIIGITADGNGVYNWIEYVTCQSTCLSDWLNILKQQRVVPAGVKPFQLLRTTGELSTSALESELVVRMTYADFESESKPLHLKSKELKSYHGGQREKWLSASVHSLEELLLAEQIGCDFALLGSVQSTASHPDIQPLGWDKFARIVSKASIPVYALGGCGMDELVRAWKAGAQGVAGISEFSGESTDSFKSLDLESAAG
jgi:8-oxo-dGTP diphosphatase